MDFNGRSGEMSVFTTVAQEGSLSAAARALGLTPSAVSRIIARTEQRLGTRLLLRTTRAITFTAEGEAFLRGARRILADMDEVEEAIADQGVPRGRLRVSAALGHGRLRLDLDRYSAFWQDQEVVLTLTEFGILRTLLGCPGKVFSREQLMDGSYQDYRVVSDRTIDSHVRRVRAKFKALGADPIDTLHGIGYRLGPC